MTYSHSIVVGPQASVARARSSEKQEQPAPAKVVDVLHAQAGAAPVEPGAWPAELLSCIIKMAFGDITARVSWKYWPIRSW